MLSTSVCTSIYSQHALPPQGRFLSVSRHDAKVDSIVVSPAKTFVASTRANGIAVYFSSTGVFLHSSFFGVSIRTLAFITATILVYSYADGRTEVVKTFRC